MTVRLDNHDDIAKELVKDEVLKPILSEVLNRWSDGEKKLQLHLNCRFLQKPAGGCDLLVDNRTEVEKWRGKPLIPVQPQYDRRSFCVWRGQDRYREWSYCPRNEEILSSRNRLSSLVRRWDPSIIRIIEAKSEVIIPPQKGFPMGFVDELVMVEVKAGDMYHFTEKLHFSFLIEVKSFVKSEGDVLRQIRLYQERYRDTFAVLVTRDPLDTASQRYFEKNGVFVHSMN